MKEQFKKIILPPLPIVGNLKIILNHLNEIISIEFSKEDPSTPQTSFSEAYHEELLSYLGGETQHLELPYRFYQISTFQLNVLQEISKIPFGETRTYKEIGQFINSKAYQAIGNACRNNPLLILFPCHRVVGKKNPHLYRGGEDMKKDLLRLER